MNDIIEEKEWEGVQEGVSDPSESGLNLFKPKGVQNHEYWQCIYYIAPTNERKDWKATDRIGIYCTECKRTLSSSVLSTKAHERHMKSVHQDLIDEFRNKNGNKQKSGEGVQKGLSDPSESGLNLFKPKGVQNHEYWQCIYYIAPTNERKDWKATDRIGIYCTECKYTVSTSVRSTKAHERHMKNVHQDLIDEFKNKHPKKEKKRKSSSKMQGISPKAPKDIKRAKPATKADQAHFTDLVARWTSCSLSPFSIVEDKGLQDLIDFATSVNGPLKLPSRDANKKRIDTLAHETRIKMMKILFGNCEYFSSTSNLWSPRAMEAFMALTLHFLCDDFQRHNFTMAIKPTDGKHTADMMKGYMKDVIDEWCLSKNKLVMMLGDSGSNVVEACEDWGVGHFPCIGHSLHLVVSPFLLEKKKNANGSGIAEAEEQGKIDEEVTIDNEQDMTCESSDDVRDDAYYDDFTLSYNDDDSLKKVRDIVSKIQKIVRYMKDSTKCKEILEKIQVNDSCEKVLRVSSDVRTRWSSTLKVLLQSLELKEPITKFLEFYKSPLGNEEFKSEETKLDIVEEKEWAIIHGICHILRIFDSATKMLSSEKYSSFVTAFPVLRSIEEKIGDAELFQFTETSSLAQSKFKTDFYGEYGHASFFESVIRDLDSCRVLLLNEFNLRFQGMKAEIMWTTLLDPRFNLNSQHWKDDAEKHLVKNFLIESIEEIAVQEAYALEVYSMEDENAIDLFGESETVVNNIKSELTSIEKAKAEAKQEAVSYLNATESCVYPKAKLDPLQWWRDNKQKYPNVAKCARKWLSVPATSTPSEHVFSICSILNTAKRSRLNGKSIEDQVFILTNKHYA